LLNRLTGTSRAIVSPIPAQPATQWMKSLRLMAKHFASLTLPESGARANSSDAEKLPCDGAKASRCCRHCLLVIDATEVERA